MATTTVEELEIVIQANVKDAVKSIQAVMAQLQKLMSAKMPNFQDQLLGSQAAVKQTFGQMSSSLNETSKQMRQLADTAKATAQTTAAAFQQTQGTIDSTGEAIQALSRQMAELANQQQQALSDVYEEPAALNSAIKQALEAEAAYQKLQKQYGAMTEAVQKYQKKIEDSQKSVEALAKATQGMFQKAAEAVKQVPVDELNKKVKVFQTDTSKATANLKKSVKDTQNAVANLKTQYLSMFSGNSFSFQGAAGDLGKMEKTLDRIANQIEKAGKKFDGVSKNIQKAVKKMDELKSSTQEAAGDSGSLFDTIFDNTKNLQSALGDMAKNVIGKFSEMGGEQGVGGFVSKLTGLVKQNIWGVLLGGVLDLAIGIGTTLFNAHKKAVEEMEANNLAHAFDGLPLEVGTVTLAMQGMVDKYALLREKADDHLLSIQSFRTAYDEAALAVQQDFAVISSSSGLTSEGVKSLTEHFQTLSGTVRQQVDNDGMYYYTQWKSFLENTGVASQEEEQKILDGIIDQSIKKKEQVGQVEQEINTLLEQYREAEQNGETEKFAAIEEKLRGHYDTLGSIAAEETERQAAIEKQRQMLLAEDILSGRKKVTEDNYEELLAEVEQAEAQSRNDIMATQAELRGNLEYNHKKRIDEMNLEGATADELREADKDYNKELQKLNEGYTKSLQDIGTESATTKTLMMQALEGPGTEAVAVQEKFNGIQEKIAELNKQKVGQFVTPEAQQQINELTAEMKKLAEDNPDILKHYWYGYEFVANDAVDKTKEVQGTIQDSIKESVQYASSSGGEISGELLGGIEKAVSENLDSFSGVGKTATDTLKSQFHTDIAEMGVELGADMKTVAENGSEGFAAYWKETNAPMNAAVDSMKGVLKGVNECLGIHSPSKEFEEVGKNTMAGLAQGINNDSNAVMTAISKLAESMKTAMQQAFSMTGSVNEFTKYGKNLMQGLSGGITTDAGQAVTAVSNAAQSVTNKIKQDFQITNDSALFQTFGKKLMDGLAQGIKNSIPAVSSALDQTKDAVEKKTGEIKKKLEEAFTLTDLSKKFTSSLDSMKLDLNGRVSSMKSTLDGFITKINNTITRLDVLRTTMNNTPSASNVTRSGGGSSSGSRSRSVPVPQLARGGVVRKPTLVHVAEYAGAANNPEIVTPQNVMYDTVVEANAPLVVALFQAVDKVVGAIEENRPVTQIGDADLFAGVKRASDKYRKQTGLAAF